jgi:hypothetical protein
MPFFFCERRFDPFAAPHVLGPPMLSFSMKHLRQPRVMNCDHLFIVEMGQHPLQRIGPEELVQHLGGTSRHRAHGIRVKRGRPPRMSLTVQPCEAIAVEALYGVMRAPDRWRGIGIRARRSRCTVHGSGWCDRLGTSYFRRRRDDLLAHLRCRGNARRQGSQRGLRCRRKCGTCWYATTREERLKIPLARALLVRALTAVTAYA